jgi:hypothetical protein
LEAARAGGGPCVVEALTYRLSDHTTADDASRYRPDEEVKHAWALEPLLRTRSYLAKAGSGTRSRSRLGCAIAPAQVERPSANISRRPKPSTDSMFDYLFASIPKHLQEQRATARRYGSKPGSHSNWRKLTMVEAIAMAHAWEMQHDPSVVVIGQDVGATAACSAPPPDCNSASASSAYRTRRSPRRRSRACGRDGGARHEAGRGNSIHGLHVSGAWIKS